MKIRGETLKSSHRLWVAVRYYCNVVSTVTNINPCSMRMDHVQTRILRLQTSRPFLSLFPISPRLVICCHSCLLTGNGIRFGPVTIGLKISPTGSKEHLCDGPSHHASDRQYRGHAQMRARSTSISSALACRTGSIPRIARSGRNSISVSGARDRVEDVVTCSDRTMVDTFQPHSLSCFRSRKRRHDNEMNLEKEKGPRISQHHMGWNVQRTFPLLPVAGEIFLLTFSFIERGNRRVDLILARGNFTGLRTNQACQIYLRLLKRTASLFSVPRRIASVAPSRDNPTSLMGSCELKCVICFAGPPERGTLQKLGTPSRTSTYSRERLSVDHIQQKLAVAGRVTVLGGCDPEEDMTVPLGSWPE